MALDKKSVSTGDSSKSIDPVLDDTESLPEPSSEVSEWTPSAIATIIGSFGSLFISVGFMNSWGVWQEYYQKHQLSSRSEFQIAWIGSFATFVMMLGGAAAGVLVDKYGPTPLLGSGCAALVLGIFMTSLCKEYWQFFLAQGLLTGLAMSFLTIPCVSTVALHFTRHRGLATGLVIAGSSMGGVIWPIVDDQLLNHRNLSFGWTMRIDGFIMLPLALLATLCVRRPKSKAPPTKPDGDDNACAQPKPEKTKVDRSNLKKPIFILFVVGVAVFNLGMFSPFFFVSAYSVHVGHTTSFAFYMVSAMNASSLFGRVLIGTLADRLGVFNLTSTAAFIGAIVCYCWTAATSEAGIATWSIAYGFSSGAILSLQMQCATALSTRETFGTALGIAFGFCSLTGLIGSPISGELVPKGYLALSTFAASTLMAGAIMVGIVRLMRSRELLAKV